MKWTARAFVGNPHRRARLVFMPTHRTEYLVTTEDIGWSWPSDAAFRMYAPGMDVDHYRLDGEHFVWVRRYRP